VSSKDEGPDSHEARLKRDVIGARSQNVISTKMITNPWSWRIWSEARATMAEFSRVLFESAKVEPYGDVIIKRPTLPPTWKRAQGRAYAPGH